MGAADRLLWRLVDLLIFAAVLGMIVLISLQVGSRLTGRSVPWTEELSRFLFLWTTFLGMSAGFRHGYHPSFSILTAMCPPQVQRGLRLLPAIAATIVFAIVAWHAWALLQQQIRIGEISPILRIGMWVTTLPLFLGAILSIVGAATSALVPAPHEASPFKEETT
jgi:TRAP-type C4-dicarboxylate transport system permease small subunit